VVSRFWAITREFATKGAGCYSVEDKKVVFLNKLLKQLKSKDIETKREAARKLGELKDRRAVEPLLEALNDGQDACRDIVWALGKIGDKRAVTPLIGLLSCDDWRLRGKAAEALGEIGGGQGVVEALLKTLEDKNDNVHWHVAWALGEIQDKRAVEPLLNFLDDSDPRRRWHAVWALGKTGDKRAVKPLIPLLRDRETLIRRNAALALSRLGDQRAAEALTACLDDPDGEVKHFATEALLAIEGSRP